SQEDKRGIRPQISRLYVDADCRTLDSVYRLPSDEQRATTAEELSRPIPAATCACMGTARSSGLFECGRGFCSLRGTCNRRTTVGEGKRHDRLLVREFLLFETGTCHRLLGRASIRSDRPLHPGLPRSEFSGRSLSSFLPEAIFMVV